MHSTDGPLLDSVLDLAARAEASERAAHEGTEPDPGIPRPAQSASVVCTPLTPLSYATRKLIGSRWNHNLGDTED